MALFGACHIFPFYKSFFSKLKSFHKTYTEVSDSLMTIRENSLQLFSIISFRGGQYFYINYTIFSSSTHQNSVITHVICIIQQSSFSSSNNNSTTVIHSFNLIHTRTGREGRKKEKGKNELYYCFAHVIR